MDTPILNLLFCFAMTAARAVAEFHIEEATGQDSAKYIIAIIAGPISRCVHLSAIEWAEDIGAKN